MAARNKMFSIDFKQFEEYGERLDQLGFDIQQSVGDAMEHAGHTVQDDVSAAVEHSNLPAQGKYSKGQTAESVISDVAVQWSGMIGELPLGFDKTKPGAGGFLITGTPKMQPDKALAKIFQSKKYKSDITKEIREELQRLINSRL